MNEIFMQVGDFLIGQNEIIMAVHKKERGLVEIWVGKPDFAFFLNDQRGGSGNQLHEVLAHPAAIVSVVQTVSNPTHEKSRLLIRWFLRQSGASGHADGKANRAEAGELR